VGPPSNLFLLIYPTKTLKTKNIITELFVVKKLPDDFKGKISIKKSRAMPGSFINTSSIMRHRHLAEMQSLLDLEHHSSLLDQMDECS